MGRLWDLATGQPAGRRLEGHAGAVQAFGAVPRPDEQALLASGSYGGTVRLWDLATGQPAWAPL